MAVVMMICHGYKGEQIGGQAGSQAEPATRHEGGQEAESWEP